MKTIRMLTAMLLAGASTLAPAQRSGNDLFQQALMRERSQGDLKGAIEIYQRIVKEFGSDRRLAARALLEMARCQEKQGNEQARRTYERLIKEFSDQASRRRRRGCGSRRWPFRRPARRRACGNCGQGGRGATGVRFRRMAAGSPMRNGRQEVSGCVTY